MTTKKQFEEEIYKFELLLTVHSNDLNDILHSIIEKSLYEDVEIVNQYKLLSQDVSYILKYNLLPLKQEIKKTYSSYSKDLKTTIHDLNKTQSYILHKLPETKIIITELAINIKNLQNKIK